MSNYACVNMHRVGRHDTKEEYDLMQRSDFAYNIFFLSEVN